MKTLFEKMRDNRPKLFKASKPVSVWPKIDFHRSASDDWMRGDKWSPDEMSKIAKRRFDMVQARVPIFEMYEVHGDSRIKPQDFWRSVEQPIEPR